eukprot:12422460-Karenia_brevis.AAC.1
MLARPACSEPTTDRGTSATSVVNMHLLGSQRWSVASSRAPASTSRSASEGITSVSSKTMVLKALHACGKTVKKV